jgi:hypothetical protein
MTTERRYSEDEVSEILDRATETDADSAHAAESGAGSSDGPSGGLTLAELHLIGEEVGIPKAVITRAATSLDRSPPGAAPVKRFMGAAIGVGRMVELPRKLTEAEWNRLVVDLRETFDAKGKIQQDGDFRQWTNGALQALLEPTEQGERLRLMTTKSNAYSMMGMGGLFSLIGAGGLFTGLGGSLEEVVVLTAMAAAGLVLHFGSRFSLPAWARTRTRQMEAIIERLAENVDD